MQAVSAANKFGSGEIEGVARNQDRNLEAPDPTAASTSSTKRYWLCQGCGTRNERRKIRCVNPGCNRRRPKRRVPAHARTLRDDPYLAYVAVNAELHGAAFGGDWQPEFCGVCGKPPSTTRHHDRDHDHTTGLPRGLACPGNQGCNALMPHQMTLERARQVVAYLERVEAYRANEGLTDAV